MRGNLEINYSAIELQQLGTAGRLRWAICLWLAVAVSTAFATLDTARAQSPELAMRDFSSVQIKKGSRVVGFGGDGATWGNYSLVWNDANTTLVDYADTHFTNGNDFHFEAAGGTTPPLWHQLAIYVIAMSQETNNVKFNASAPGLGSGVPMTGKGVDEGFFTKIAMPLGNGFSAGIMLAHEVSRFDATSVAGQLTRWETEWRPSGGFGVTWQSDDKKWLLGFRVILDNDLERRIAPGGVAEGLASSQEYRVGASYAVWQGGLLDIGTTHLEKRDEITGTSFARTFPNLGFEQTLLDSALTFRFGLDETSPTAGITLKYAPWRLDIAYVHDMALGRVGDVFGTTSDSVFLSLTWDYSGLSTPAAPSPSSMRNASLRGPDAWRLTQ
jgi:hypothetical protein